MKVILLRDKGVNFTVQVSRALSVGLTVAVVSVLVGGIVWATQFADFQAAQHNQSNAKAVGQLRAKLKAQRNVVIDIEQKYAAQTAAIGRQLADMKARLLRMEAVGAHMASSAQLDAAEFDFTNPPAQGGPIEGEQPAWTTTELSAELARLSEQIRDRETELAILDTVLIHEELNHGSVVRGRPVKWGWLSSPYGKRVDPLTGKAGWHAGVDFAGRDGSDVITVASGVVTFAGERSGYGKIVEVSHAGGYITRYAHHKELVVTTGDIVKKGAVLGRMGSSGRSTGPHVHFEVLKNGRTVDPATYVARRS